MFFFSIFLSNFLITNVYADSFYEAEYIDGIYMNKYQYSTHTIYYQKARFFRKAGSNEFAYCIEPFNFFNESRPYTSTVNPRNLSKAQIDRISKIAHFGYGYKDHGDLKWYAITQLMIWQAADSSGDYYFTDGLNGNRINPYQQEINQINNLINNYDIKPTFTNKTYTIVEDHNLVIEDQNNVISNFKTDNKDITITGNKVTINSLKEGSYKYNFYKQDNYYNKPLVFYQANDSQNLVNTGDLNKIQIAFNIKVIKTKLELSKIDKDTKDTNPRGEASLDGAIYNLYDMNDNLVSTLTIENNQATLDNINFGKYYLIEEKPGIGYTLDSNKYEINISEENHTIQLVLENKVIEKKIIIKKKYGDNNNFMQEKDISFHILNNKDELIDTITTNEEGIAEIILPYGTYKIIQVNSTDGYTKVDPFTITVDNTDDELIELKDLRIPVPNTHTDRNNIFMLLLEIILIIL